MPTKERILNTALELFALKGYDAVSVRDITGALGLNEASLYNHYKNKWNLFETILNRLNERLIQPGFKSLPREFFQGEEPFDLGGFLIKGAEYFFSRADREVLLTWRILMMNQYRYEEARDSVRELLLNPPCRFFTEILTVLKEAGKVRSGIDCESGGRVIASLFFDYSFRSNLSAAWEEKDSRMFEKLADDLQFISSALAV